MVIQTWLSGAILRDLSRIFKVATGSLVGAGKHGAQEDPVVMDKSPATAYVYTVNLSSCTTATGVPSQAVQTGLSCKSGQVS